MSVLVFADHSEGKFKKTAYEIVSFGKQLAKKAETSLTVVTINASEVDSLSEYGPDKILSIENERLGTFNAQAYAACIAQAAEKESATIVAIDSSNDGLYLAPILSVKLNAGFASNVVDYPTSQNPFTVKRKAFSSKGFNFTEIHTDIKLLGLAKNSVGLIEEKSSPEIESFSPGLEDKMFSVTSKSIDKTTGTVTIADADVVVSGGRGLKGPENWGMIEELADVLGAATACSKPVSDMGWRPHSEHVGQTGKPVTSNLYIAIGISGAIQHLAGVNSSKVKVVVNNDPEAPFFKAADYGIVGDAFEVIPELTNKLKDFKSTL
ncbi:electron transfer flavoprotein subunit alpha/FixB family protein [Lutimonas saemankumensis]|uniref:electron transfer flavoprotein subunit alpha/FixB family protein n=1 Tax=Lutimonas saemankumensis TaxID=483016 RepID=UPI001CD4AB6D|nr:electron transfer flavoprotein subunit alpha/FixB family protein [Lutimonas saemankumensis]MCA0933549.1 electron transfer flavoprotein subunit alpha/FixB family protein [Lutimonas saemankumensis]